VDREQRLFAVALGLAVVLLIVAWGVVRTQAQSGAEICVQVPSPPEIAPSGGEATVTIVVTATELFGYQFVATFDPALLEAVHAEFDASFVNPEYIPSGWDAEIDNVAGTVHFAATQYLPTRHRRRLGRGLSRGSPSGPSLRRPRPSRQRSGCPASSWQIGTARYWSH